MFEKLLNLMSFNDIDDEDNYDDDYYEDEPETRTPKRTLSSTSKKSGEASEREEKQPSPFEQARKERAAKYDRQSKVVPYNKKDAKSFEVCVRKPDSYSDAEQICDLLIDGNPVIVNFEGFDSYEAQRTMEFICGCIYALNGDMNQISKYIFIFSPAGVDIMGDIIMDDGSIPTFNNNF